MSASPDGAALAIHRNEFATNAKAMKDRKGTIGTADMKGQHEPNG